MYINLGYDHSSHGRAYTPHFTQPFSINWMLLQDGAQALEVLGLLLVQFNVLSDQAEFRIAGYDFIPLEFSEGWQFGYAVSDAVEGLAELRQDGLPYLVEFSFRVARLLPQLHFKVTDNAVSHLNSQFLNIIGAAHDYAQIASLIIHSLAFLNG